MATFGDVINEVTQKIDQVYLGTGDATSRVADAINEAINYFEPERFWFNEAIATITLTVNDPVIPNIPSDLLYVMDNGGMAINFSSTQWILRRVSIAEYDAQNYEGQGLPSIYKEVGGVFSVYFFPDQAYTLKLRYVKSYVDMTTTGETNDWLDNARRLIVAKTLEDLYIDARHDTAGSGLYERYVQKRQDEMNQLKDRNFPRISSGRLVTDDFITVRDSHSEYIY